MQEEQSQQQSQVPSQRNSKHLKHPSITPKSGSEACVPHDTLPICRLVEVEELGGKKGGLGSREHLLLREPFLICQ